MGKKVKQTLGFLNQARKSKTVDLNALLTAIVAACGACGLDIPQAVVAVVYMIMNIILRHYTTEPLKDK
jgi:hypothetical protein